MKTKGIRISFMLIMILCGRGIFAQCFLFGAKEQKKIQEVTSSYDSMILCHYCGLEACIDDFRGVGFRSGKAYEVKMGTGFDEARGTRGKFSSSEILITDPLRIDSFVHAPIRGIMGLSHDSLNYAPKDRCRYMDGDRSIIYFILKSTVLVQSAYLPELLQECHYTDERAFFLYVFHLISGQE